MKDKRGWIKIVEAFVAILLVAGVLLVVVSEGYLGEKDISSTVYDAEISILREIQLNDSLRKDILNAGALPIGWDNANFPLSVKNKIINRAPNYLDCEAKICGLNKTCESYAYPGKEVYAQPVIIMSTLTELDYRQLKLFCWVK